MTKSVDYYFALISPWTYMGLSRLVEVVGKTGATLNYKPVDILSVFAQSGGVPAGQRPPARRAYRMMELKRWRRRLGVDLNLEPKFFPADETLASLCVAAEVAAGRDAGPLCKAFHEVVWMREENIADRDTIAQALARAGAPGDTLERAETDEVKALRDRFTAEAVAAGVFGAPSYVVDGELFWGQDRLDFLAEKLGG